MATTQKVKKRNGEIVDFHPEKITIAVQKAFAAVLGDSHEADAADITRVVVDAIDMKFGATAFFPTVEDIQDLVENALMERGYFGVAKDYIIYRYEHSKLRQEAKEEVIEKIIEHSLMIQKRDGTLQPFSESKLTRTLLRAAEGMERVIDVPAVIARVRAEMYDQIKTKDIHDVLIMVVRSMIERDPAHSTVASRLLLQSLYSQVLGDTDYTKLEETYKVAFIRAINRGVEIGQFDPRMLDFDLNRLADALIVERDRDFKYLGLQTLQANYLSKEHGSRKLLETPQIFWMRVAMGCALAEKTPEERERYAIEFYEVMSAMYYTPSSPTLYHAGLKLPQLSSCFLSTVGDDLHAIFREYSDGAQLLKYAGGLGTDWTAVRATGSLVKTTGVESQGVIPFLKIANDVTISINRSGRRRGAQAVYLEYWHADIEDFIELRKNTGDERRRAHDLNTAVWIPDLFMQRVEQDLPWSLFDPQDVPEFTDLFGEAFASAYCAAEAAGLAVRELPARDIYGKMMRTLAQTGQGWMTFKDASNVKSNQTAEGENVVHLSNLCTEIIEVTRAGRTAVCNLGSVNLKQHVTENGFDYAKLAHTVRLAVRQLNAVIDKTFYPIESAEASNFEWRPVALGIMGLQDVFFVLGLPFDSEEALKVSTRIQEEIYFHALLTSCELAEEQGPHPTFAQSRAARGELQFDAWGVTPTDPERWESLRARIKEKGLRNSLLIAIAPTSTIASISGCYECIEPQISNLFKRETLSGEFLQINSYLVNDLKKLGLWTEDIRERITHAEGSIADIEEIPQALRERYRTTWELPQKALIDLAAARGAYIDQSQSLNLFAESPNIGKLSSMYLYAWKKGLKTTYYLRSRPATRIAKTTMRPSEAAVAVPDADAVACSLENPESCEACQ